MSGLRRKLFSFIALLALAGWPAVVWAEQPHPFAGNRVATVMTRNVYAGGDLAPVIAAPPDQLFQAVAAAYAQVQANNFPVRAEALAREIDRARPDLVGLQEASLFRTQTPANGPGSPATTVAYDYLQILVDRLAQRGLRYEVVGVLQTLDVEIPGAFSPPSPLAPLSDIRLTDRIAIIARADQTTADLKLSNVRTGSFTAFLTVPTNAGPPIASRRGWVSVDAKVRGKSFRFITTHLEPLHPGIQVAQAGELLNGPVNTSLPVIMAGDFNTRADGTGTATYGIVTAAGFADAWSQAHPGSPGYTCCHPADLQVVGPPLDERIDLILTRGGFVALSAVVLGDAPADRMPSGLWPSDHAGVAAALGLP